MTIVETIGLFIIFAFLIGVFTISVRICELIIDLIEYYTGKNLDQILRPWEDLDK